MTDKKKFMAAVRLLKYATFIVFMGGLTQFVLPPEKNVWLRMSFGIVTGMAMLGEKLPDAIRDYFKAITDSIFE